MTLSEFLKVLKHYLAWIVIVPIVVAVACAAYMHSQPKSYEAVATLTPSEHINLVRSLVDQEITSQEFDSTLSSDIDAATGSITVTASGSDEKACVKEANAVATAAVESIPDYRPATKKVVCTVVKATEANDTSKSPKKYVAAAWGGTLLVVVVCVVLLDLARCPVHDRKRLEDALGIPSLATLPTSNADEQLFANVMLAADGQAKKLCFVPVSDKLDAAPAANLVYQGAQKQGTEAAIANDFSAAGQGITLACASATTLGVFTVKESDAVVLVIGEWVSTWKQLEEVVAELKLAKANVVGFVYQKKSFKGTGRA